MKHTLNLYKLRSILAFVVFVITGIFIVICYRNGAGSIWQAINVAVEVISAVCFYFFFKKYTEEKEKWDSAINIHCKDLPAYEKLYKHICKVIEIWQIKDFDGTGSCFYCKVIFDDKIGQRYILQTVENPLTVDFKDDERHEYVVAMRNMIGNNNSNLYGCDTFFLEETGAVIILSRNGENVHMIYVDGKMSIQIGSLFSARAIKANKLV